MGKSTVARELLGREDDCVWLEGDDLWRMQPFVVNDVTTKMVEKNIQFVLRSFLDAGFENIFFTWVMHRQEIVDRLLEGLNGEQFHFSMFTLVCDEQTLLRRISQDPGRETDTQLALERLGQTQRVDTVKIDTVGKEPGAIVEELIQHIRRTDVADA